LRGIRLTTRARATASACRGTTNNLAGDQNPAHLAAEHDMLHALGLPGRRVLCCRSLASDIPPSFPI
jgi:hypothetical protein